MMELQINLSAATIFLARVVKLTANHACVQSPQPMRVSWPVRKIRSFSLPLSLSLSLSDKYSLSLPLQWRTQKGVWGFVPAEHFWIFRLKNTRVFFKFRGTLPNIFSWLMLPVVVAHSYYSFTSAVHAFQQAPSLQEKKLVIGWKSWELYKALLDVVEFRTENLPPYSLRLSQKLANCFIM